MSLCFGDGRATIPRYFASPNLSRAIAPQLRWLPVWLRGYVIALLSFVFVVVLSMALLHTVGAKAMAFCALLLLILMARAAWLGYGPGLVVCLLTMFVAQSILVPGHPHPVEPIRFGFLVVILLLISRLAQNKRNTEDSLRRAAESLEQRVAERTQELSTKEERLREQAQLLDLAPVAILALDLDSIIRVWSRGAEKVYGW